jgi:hypothetical protein
MPIFLIFIIGSCIWAVVAVGEEMSVGWRIAASVQVFLAAFFAVGCAGVHMCHEGGSPLFLNLAVGALASIVPWFHKWNVWVLRACIIVVTIVGMHTARFLAHSYHGDTITGNPRFSSGRFWHTPFTGQYPRDQSLPRE